MLWSTSADHRCRPRCLITDNSYNLLLLDSLSVLENVFIFKVAVIQRCDATKSLKNEAAGEHLNAFLTKKASEIADAARLLTSRSLTVLICWNL